MLSVKISASSKEAFKCYAMRLDFLLITAFAAAGLYVAYSIVIFLQISIPPFVARVGVINPLSPILWNPNDAFGEPKARTAWILLCFVCAIGDIGLLTLTIRTTYRCLLARREDLSIGGYSLSELLTILRWRALPALALLAISVVFLGWLGWTIVSGLSGHERGLGTEDSPFLESFVKGMLGTLNFVNHGSVSAFVLQVCIPIVSLFLALTIAAISIAIPSTASGWWFAKVDDFIDDAHLLKFNKKVVGSGPPAGPYDVLLFTQAERVDYLKRLIYASAALESLAIASLSAFFTWLASGNSTITSINALSIGQIYVFRFSGLCSAGLMFLYIPTAMVLGWRAGRLHPYFSNGIVVPFGTRQRDMQLTAGTDLGVAQHIGAIASTMLPLVTGTAASAAVGWF